MNRRPLIALAALTIPALACGLSLEAGTADETPGSSSSGDVPSGSSGAGGSSSSGAASSSGGSSSSGEITSSSSSSSSSGDTSSSSSSSGSSSGDTSSSSSSSSSGGSSGGEPACQTYEYPNGAAILQACQSNALSCHPLLPLSNGDFAYPSCDNGVCPASLRHTESYPGDTQLAVEFELTSQGKRALVGVVFHAAGASTGGSVCDQVRDGAALAATYLTNAGWHTPAIITDEDSCRAFYASAALDDMDNVPATPLQFSATRQGIGVRVVANGESAGSAWTVPASLRAYAAVRSTNGNLSIKNLTFDPCGP